jgi:spermidine synthase
VFGQSPPLNSTALKVRVSNPAAPSPRPHRLISVLFFCSGATSLAYEVVWFKRFSHVWGNSALAMALVVACFLLGLGAGALLFGRWADRIRSPLLWYGWCEAGIGLLALLIPFEIGWLGGLNSWLYSHLHDAGLFHALARGLLTLLVIGPPCVLMGGTLPLLVKQTVAGPEDAGRSTAWLYGINTAGAAMGCLAAGFWLIPSFGLAWTNIAVAAGNGAIAAVALLAARRFALSSVPAPASGSTPPAPGAAGRPAMWIYAAVILTGLASLMLQMIWTRQLAVMLGGSTYAFTTTLFIFLTGVGLGSLLCRFLQRRNADPIRLIAITIGLLVVFTAAGRFAIPAATDFVGLAASFRDSQFANALVCVGGGLLLEFLPAIGMGVLFPLLVGIASQHKNRIGNTVGAIYAWNTLGSIGGAFLTMLVLVPALTLPKATALALALYLGALLLVHFKARVRTSGSVVLVSLFAGTVAALFAARPLDPRLTDYGAFLYGYMPADELLRDMKVLFFREGPACNVLVVESGDHRWLRVNGKTDASTQVDMETQLALAYLPRCLKPEAQDVLIIGHGSGVTAGASLLFPGTTVTCCEIEPGILEGSRFFSAVNHGPESSGRFTPVLDDGRSFLQATERRFDLIISEPSNPWLAGISSLFTRECYAAARARLKPGGLFAQWVHLYSLDRADYTMILRTVQAVFPYAALVWINDNNTIIVASEQPITPTPNTLERAQKLVNGLPPVKADLQRYFQATSLPALLLSRYLLDEQALKTFVDSAPSGQLHTDVNLRLEFDAPRRLYRGPTDAASSPARIVLRAAGEALCISKIMQAHGSTPEALLALKYQTALFNRHGNAAAVQNAARLGSRAASGDPFFLTHLLLSPEALDDASFAQAAARLVEVSPDEAANVGGGLWQRRKHQRAAVIFESLVKRHPSSATVWMGLAMNLHALGRSADAELARKKALQLDPLAGFIRSSITALEAQLQKTESKVAIETPPLSLPADGAIPGKVE